MIEGERESVRIHLLTSSLQRVALLVHSALSLIVLPSFPSLSPFPLLLPPPPFTPLSPQLYPFESEFNPLQRHRTIIRLLVSDVPPRDFPLLSSRSPPRRERTGHCSRNISNPFVECFQLHVDDPHVHARTRIYVRSGVIVSRDMIR